MLGCHFVDELPIRNPAILVLIEPFHDQLEFFFVGEVSGLAQGSSELALVNVAVPVSVKEDESVPKAEMGSLREAVPQGFGLPLVLEMTAPELADLVPGLGRKDIRRGSSNFAEVEVRAVGQETGVLFVQGVH